MLTIIKNFLGRLLGGVFCLFSLSLIISMFSYDKSDISFNNSLSGTPKNVMGIFGSYSADILWQVFGIVIIPLLLFFAFLGGLKFLKKDLGHSYLKFFGIIISTASLFILFYHLDGKIINIENPIGVLHKFCPNFRISLYKTNPYIFIFLFSSLTLMTFFYSLNIFSLFKMKKYDDDETAVKKTEKPEKFEEKRKKRKEEKERIEPIIDIFEPAQVKPSFIKSCFSTNEKSVKEKIEPIIENNQKKPSEKKAPVINRIQGNGSYTPPSLNLLENPKDDNDTYASKEMMLETGTKLQKVLHDFDIKGKIISFKSGPIVTLYEFEPDVGIRNSRIISLADDIARAMSSASVRIAPIPRTNLMGIEVPNEKRKIVLLKELFNTDSFVNAPKKLCLALGKDITGKPFYANLEDMPHLLVAGTTGSGKSVAINTIILSLIYRLSPEECRLIMIDPKMLELSIYNDIPHLLTPVVTEPAKAVSALKWAVKEMNNRYRLMSDSNTRNIENYNLKVREMLKTNTSLSRTVQTGFDDSGKPITETVEKQLEPLPYIVVIIDEMADLMLYAKKDINDLVQNLAQKARAAGIHIITATQRPSVDVITGVIKANFPTRISFQVTSKIDSRTILNEQGAEQLLGKGDMLYQPAGKKPLRLHGPFVSDNEVEEITDYLRTLGDADYIENITVDSENEMGSNSASNSDNEDGKDLYAQAVDIVLNDRKISISYIQRRLSIGYNKAATIVERMEDEGIISKADHVGKREILIN